LASFGQFLASFGKYLGASMRNSKDRRGLEIEVPTCKTLAVRCAAHFARVWTRKTHGELAGACVARRLSAHSCAGGLLVAGL
jgi:hypothetical protein